MLTNLISAILLVVSIGSGTQQKTNNTTNFKHEKAPMFLNIEPTKKETRHSTLNVNTYKNINYQVDNYYDNTQPNYSDGQYRKSFRYDIDQYNTDIMIKGNIYYQNYMVNEQVGNRTLQYTYFTWTGNRLNTGSNIISNTTSAYYILEITPYGNTLNQQFTINYGFYYLLDQGQTMYTKITIITSIDNALAQLINKQNYNTTNMVNDDIRELTTGTLYNYNTEEQSIYEETESNTTADYKTYTKNITLLNNIKNYLIICLQPNAYNQTQPTTQSITQETSLQYMQGTQEYDYCYYCFDTYTISNETITPISIGLDVSEAAGVYEVVDIPGLVFEIVTAPFTFISVAFNLTLFPGTPYQVNLSNLFLTIIAIAVFLFIMRLFMKK